jgi:serine-type D-Ala-D-Ala carboxypeptidase/endopeptidase (penicillin-binding protein 4)
MKSNYFPLLKQTLTVILFAIIVATNLLFAQSEISYRNLEGKINTFLSDSTFIPCSVGIVITIAENGESIYSLNGDKLFHPASNMKLLTTATAIHFLPSKFRFKTIISTNGIVRDKILNGDLILSGFGDPLFTTSDLDSIVLFLKYSGIKAIKGKIKFETGYFDTLKWGLGWMWDDEPYPTAPFITALVIDHNVISIVITPNKNLNETPSITTIPESDYFKFNNTAVTSNDSLIPEILVTRNHGSDTIRITGRIEPLVNPEEFKISIAEPETYLYNLLLYKLRQSGISVNENLINAKNLKTYPLITKYHDLDSVIHSANKLSDNLSAECLLKTIAAENTGIPGSAENGIKYVKQFLYDSGIDTTVLFIADGSGASWYNTLTPNTIVNLLCREYRDKSSFERFYESLAVAGNDGTLKNRMSGTSAQNNVHGKTGTLTGCNGISGYVRTKNDVLLAFSILINHCTMNQNEMRRFEDEVIEFLARSSLK